MHDARAIRVVMTVDSLDGRCLCLSPPRDPPALGKTSVLQTWRFPSFSLHWLSRKCRAVFRDYWQSFAQLMWFLIHAHWLHVLYLILFFSQLIMQKQFDRWVLLHYFRFGYRELSQVTTGLRPHIKREISHESLKTSVAHHVVSSCLIASVITMSINHPELWKKNQWRRYDDDWWVTQVMEYTSRRLWTTIYCVHPNSRVSYHSSHHPSLLHSFSRMRAGLWVSLTVQGFGLSFAKCSVHWFALRAVIRECSNLHCPVVELQLVRSSALTSYTRVYNLQSVDDASHR